MKRVAGMAAVLAVMAGFVYAEGAPVVGVSLDAASAYVFRGVTFNDGMVLQPGASAELKGVTAGVWGNYDIDDYGGALKKNAISEVDYYASYAVPAGCVELSAGYTAYTYHHSEADDDHEVSLGATLDVLLSPSLTVYYGLDGAIEKATYIEAGIGHEWGLSDDVTLNADAALGYLSPDAGEEGFSHANFTVGASYKIVSASVTYVAQIDDNVLGDAYDTEMYGMASIGSEF